MRRVDGSPTIRATLRECATRYLGGAAVLALFEVAMNRIDWLSKDTVDAAFAGDRRRVFLAASLMLGLAAFAFIARVGSQYLILGAGVRAEYGLRKRLLDKIHRLGPALSRRVPAGDVMSRATNDLGQVRAVFGFGALGTAQFAFALISTLQVMTRISWRMTLVVPVVLALTMLITRRLWSQLLARSQTNQEALGQVAAFAERNLAGARTVRAFALEDREAERFDDRNAALARASISVSFLRALMSPGIGGVVGLGTLLFYWYGSLLLYRSVPPGGFSKGNFFAFSLAFTRMTQAIISLGIVYSVLQRGRACLARVDALLLLTPDVLDTGKRVPADMTVSVDSLTFATAGKTILDDVSLEVPAGHSIAIVGRSGSGKSTLARLIARLLPTPAGTVRIGGVDICDIPIVELRRILTFGEQEAFLFSTTASRNIGLAVDEYESDLAVSRIREAAGAAQVLEELLALPSGLDTVVGERGVQLSGGQRQRVALARTFLAGRPVLVVDDPMSAVDAKTEAAILDELRRYADRRTLILVTHRVAAAASCERIVVLDAGRVVERGTHDELLAARGLYWSFAEEQRIASALTHLEAVPKWASQSQH